MNGYRVPSAAAALPNPGEVPGFWVGPVRSHCTPMTMSSFDWAMYGVGASRPLPPSTSANAIARTCLMSVLLSSRTSVREWPDPEVVPDVPPQAVEALRLHDQEEDDQGAGEHDTEIGDEVEDGPGVEEHPTEALHEASDHDRQQRDEKGAEDRALDRPQTPDDDHGQVVDRHAELELLVIRDPEKVGVHHAGHPGIEGRDGKRQKLVAKNVDPDDLGRDVLVADGDEGSPDPGPHEVHGAERRQDHEEEEEVIHVALGAERHGPEPRSRDLDRGLHPPADEGHVVDDPLDDELPGEGRDRQVEPLDAEGRNADNYSY